MGTLGRLAYRYNDVIADARADGRGAVLAVTWRVAGGGFGRCFEPLRDAIQRAVFHSLRMIAIIAIIAICDIFCDFMQLDAIRPYADNSLPKLWAAG